jgi:hypothetical protein
MASSEQNSLAIAASFANGLAVLREPRRVEHEVLARLDLGGHVGQLELHALEAGDRLAELLADRRVAQRLFEGALRDAERERGDADAAGVERLHEVDEPHPLLAEPFSTGTSTSSR